ncbi:MAG: arsenate reductase [Sphingobacteriales bacterium]|nr:MAG: arsenate reductase [Sphingobacteriales bacterium]
MGITVYHNIECSKSNSVTELLDEAGIPFKVRNYILQPLNEEELKELLEKLNIEPIELVRKGEPLYKEQYESKNLSASEWIQVLAANPMLIERPVVAKDGEAIIARPPEKVKTFINFNSPA